jgi:hypothetical protein
MPLITEGLPALSIDDLREVGQNPARFREVLLRRFANMPDAFCEASARWRLTHHLAQVMLAGMSRLVRSVDRDARALLDAATVVLPSDDAGSIDVRYLATLVLTFMVLHEHAHLLHQHDSLDPMQNDPQVDAIVEGAKRFGAEQGIETVDLRESRQRLEQDADCFAIEAVPAPYRDAILEAGTLWFAALASADRGRPDWLERSAEAKGRAYPQYAMRVWFLNGRYSEGRRQGDVARASTRTAQAIEARPSDDDVPMVVLLPAFRALWDIAREMSRA